MAMAWKRITILLVGAACFRGSIVAGDWPQFRGPNNSGVCPQSQAPSEWSDTKNLAWTQKIPGYGWSSPIVVGDKIIVTTAVTEKQKRPQPLGFGMFLKAKPPDTVYRWEVHCLDRNTGKTLWSQVALERKPRTAVTFGNTYASETPVSDGVCVYAYFGMHGVYCYTLDGKEVWQKDLGAYPMLMNWGTGSSPALDGDRLFIVCDNDEKSFLVALDKKTGKELWRVTRDEKSNWTTPFVWRNQVRVEMVTAGHNAIRSYDPADGKILWELKRPAASSMSFVNATPVAAESMLYVAAGSKPGSSPLWAVKAGASGDISLKSGETSNASIAWSSTKACPPMASPLLYKDHLYILMEKGGILMCLDARTGKEVYKERLKGAGTFTSSPWVRDGKLYCLAEDGETFVVEAGTKFQLLGKNEIKDMFWATPALSHDSLYLRGADRLYCIRK
jgi:outer membrane protein assembly factor BamB